MNKKKAFNFVEMVIVLVIVGVVTVVFLQTVKPMKRSEGSDRGEFFVATWDNLMKANEELIYQNEQQGGSGLHGFYCNNITNFLEKRFERYNSTFFDTACANNGNSCRSYQMTLSNGVRLFKMIGRNGNNAVNVDDGDIDTAKFDIIKAGFIIREHSGSQDDECIYQNFRINLEDGMVIPIDCPNVNTNYEECTVSNKTNIYKFRVVSRETGETLESTERGTCFNKAACIAWGARSDYGITNCNNIECDNIRETVTRDNHCPYLKSCYLEIVMPKLKSAF